MASPMMEHYMSVKKKYPDCVLFYRLGDFYEMFNEDAIKVSKMLDLTLTGKDCGLEERAPMCGIPYHAADSYIAKLVSFGEKVAICEQLQSASEAKGMVERDVVRIVTSGTITENELLDEKSNNYMLAISKIGEETAIAWTDITTGDFKVTKLIKNADKEAVFDALSKISPSEIICNQEIYTKFYNLPEIKNGQYAKFSLFKEWAFNSLHAEKTLKEHFNVLNLTPYGIENDTVIISACGALIEYLSDTQKHALININNIVTENDSEYMKLDSVAIRNLELTKTMRDGKRYGSLLWLLDSTETAMGSRNLANWITSPLLSIEKINYRLDGVEELYKNPLMRNAVKDVLSSIRDTERLSGKISNNNITPRDCLHLASSLSVFPSIKFTLSGATSKILMDVNAYVKDFTEITSLLQKAIDPNAPINLKDGGYIKSGFDKELDRLREISKNSSDALQKMLEEEREKTGIKNLKIGFNKVFGYYLEVTNSFKDLVPYNYVRKQTLVGAERFITEELKNFEEEILTSKEKSLKIESDIFTKIKGLLSQNIKDLQISSKAIAVLDTITSFAYVAKKNNYVKPTISGYGSKLNLIGGRHPVVEAILNEQFISNDTFSDNENNRMIIITGPNMAGKSTYMRQVALITLMAHIGAFVPCKQAEIPLTDRIFTRVGASDNLISDQSTFMVEMNEVSLILNKATENSLLILDEVGRGTSTYDGLSIAWAVVEYISSKIKAKTFFATHYHELSTLEGKLDGVKNYKVTVKEINGNIIFLRKIQEGSANRSFGIEVASLAGVPKIVTDRAKKILKKLENSEITVKNAEEIPTSIEYDNEVLTSIKNLDLDGLSPKDALDILYQLKSVIGK
ncbi:MAG: DNA mismatch repair protein MutS [Clostridia bacterium]|nr:DNA mismatch repair protein MutS [Clostridia bacterium]